MLSIFLLFISLFLWAYSLPLLLLCALFALPVFFPIYIVHEFLKRLGNNFTSPCTQSSVRTVLNNIDFTWWFGKIDRIAVQEKCLICCHPHNIFSIAILFGVHFVPKSRTLIAVAPLVYHVPFIGYLATLIGCIPCDKKHIANALNNNHSVILIPGGVPEIVSFEKKRLYTERYGMFKFGCKILPVVVTSTHYWVPQLPMYEMRIFIANKYKIPIISPIIFGWYGTLLPKRKHIELKVLEMYEWKNNNEYFKKINNIYN